MPVRPNACHIGASCESFFFFTILKHTRIPIPERIRTSLCMIVYKREENRESETIKVVQSKWKKKIREKEEKKDRCTHDVFSRPSTFLRMYFNIVNLWNIRWRVSHVSIMKRGIGGQPFNDNDLFFFTMMTMFFCRETLLRLHNYRSKCGTWNIFWIFFSYFGECKCIFAELSGANNNYIRKEGGKHVDPFERKHTRFWNASRKNNLYCSHVLSSSNPKITVFPRNKKKKRNRIPTSKFS